MCPFENWGSELANQLSSVMVIFCTVFYHSLMHEYRIQNYLFSLKEFANVCLCSQGSSLLSAIPVDSNLNNYN